MALGYIYDEETQLYYCQSRYYDPEIGRWLNADAFASTGQGLLGNNMFAYCGNNPVNYSDPSGNAYQGIFSQINYNEHDHTYGGLRENFYALPEETFLRKAEKYIMNDDESVVLNAEDFAFYKGTIVIKVQAMDDNAFSFGIIFMGPNVSDPELVKHERGHVDQLLELGIADYLQHVVIPSTACFWMTEYGSFPDSLYHSMPWEYTANMYGGASFRFTDWAEPVADIYWAYVKTVSIMSP